MKYIRKFNNIQERDAALANVDFGVLSGVMNGNTMTVGYNEKPVAPQHDYVEIGGIKWATMNIGASTIYDAGFYFQWGDTQGYPASQIGEGSGQKIFWRRDYKWYNESIMNFTKYSKQDGKRTLDLEDDAVNAAWGGNWRMPTTTQCQTLINATNYSWTNNYNNTGVEGGIFTDKNDSSKVLFFPAAGIGSDGSIRNGEGGYWNDSCDNSNLNNAYYMSILSGAPNANNTYYRYYGLSVRGVLAE